MRTLKLLRRYKDKQAGDTIEMSNNVAHALIENHVAVLLSFDASGKPVEISDINLITSEQEKSEMPKEKKDHLKKSFLKPPKDKMMKPDMIRHIKIK